MSNVNVYFGAQPSGSQVVSDVVKAQGLELLKIEPSKVNFHGHPTTVQPGYAVYKAYLPMFMAQAQGKEITDFTDPFNKIDIRGDNRLPFTFPALSVSWNIAIAEEVKEQMRGKGFVDTVIRGKPAMSKRDPGPQDIRDALERGCISTTPAPEGSVNIAAFRKCWVIQRMLTKFLESHQYPAFIDKDHESEFNKSYQEILNEHKPEEISGMDTDGDEAEGDAKPVLKRAFKVTLPTPPSEYPVYWNEPEMPRGEGLLFPYVQELAKFDRITVITTIRRYFYAGLGDSAEVCDEEFQELVAAWGNIQNTAWANIMSHIFKVVDIALTLQCCPHIMMTAGQYDGVFMRGSGFLVNVLGRTYEPASRGLVDAQLSHMNSHGNALWAILERLELTEEQRQAFFGVARSMKELKVLCDTKAVIGGAVSQAQVLESAKRLKFPDDVPWAPTAFNIAEALSFVTEPTKDLRGLPYLHHSVLFRSDRLDLIWSAFGPIAPSFRVPGGKEMFLTKSFRITNPQIKKEKGPQGHRDVTKIGCILVPLDVAIQHLKTTLDLKTVLNPHGNARVDKSASHANKVFDSDSCSMIVAALRSAAKVTVVDEAGTKKRRQEGDETGGPSKKGRLELDF